MSEPARNLKAERITLMRQYTAESFNAIANHPSIEQWVRGPLQGEMDFTPVIESPNNILLAGPHGNVLFAMLQPGLYDAHVMVLPEGRGKWAREMLQSALHWVFTRTDAVEVMCRIPDGNLAAHTIARSVGGEQEYTIQRAWVAGGHRVNITVYSLSVQRWLRSAPGLVDRGRWLSRRIKRGMDRAGALPVSFIENKVQDRYAGAAADMIIGGQPGKAVAIYNRWAVVAGGTPIRLAVIRPPTIDLGQVLLIFRGEDLQVIPCLQQ